MKIVDERIGTDPVSRILLASDLSCRCDRALERACNLAARWGAKLIVATALEEDFHRPSWRSQRQSVIAEVRAELEQELTDRSFVWDVVVEPAEPDELILETAAQQDCQLIVTGVARNEMLGRATPGRTVEVLVKHAPVPVLIVKRRTHNDYRRILVLTNFSAASEAAAVQAARLFPEADLTLLHAFRVPFSGFISEGGNQEPLRAAALEAEAASLARLKPHLAPDRRLTALVEYGSPDELAADYIRSQAPDLIVLGRRHRRGRTTGLVERMLISARSDVLIVPTSPA